MRELSDQPHDTLSKCGRGSWLRVRVEVWLSRVRNRDSMIMVQVRVSKDGVSGLAMSPSCTFRIYIS